MVYIKWFHKFCSSILVLSCFAICAQSDVPRPRGVSLSKASLYAATKDFTCLDGTVSIPFSYVNDDYCDCFDGSDEPGTSACLNGVFHCTNAGHRPQNLPSSRVNDGVCDCCDGTDEYANPNQCQNTCEELGMEARAEAQRLSELLKAGSQIRIDLIQRGNKKRNEMAEQLTQLEKDKAEADKIKQEKENLKNELESKENEALKVYRQAEEVERQRKLEEEQQATKKEAVNHFTRFDSDNDGMLTIIEIQTRNVFDQDKNGEVSEEEAKYFLGDNDSVDLDTFMSTTWPLLKPLIMLEQGLFRPPAERGDAEQEPEETEDLNEFGEHEHEDLDEAEAGEEEAAEDIEEPEVEQARSYDEETQKLIDEASDARRQHTEAERTVREIDSNIRTIQENLEKDYGLQQEFATLDGQCYEFDDKEYTYKLCMFQKVTQKSKNGGSEVGLGNWGEWGGDANYLYTAMKYTDGVACWNGPNRMTVVNIQCGLDTRILSVSEPSRCEYKMELATPAACDESIQTQHTSHDEL